MKLCDLGVDIEQEDDSNGFMGVNLERDEETGLINTKQPLLINRAIISVYNLL